MFAQETGHVNKQHCHRSLKNDFLQHREEEHADEIDIYSWPQNRKEASIFTAELINSDKMDRASGGSRYHGLLRGDHKHNIYIYKGYSNVKNYYILIWKA